MKKTAKTNKKTATPSGKKNEANAKDYGVQAKIPVSTKKTLNEIWGKKHSPFKTSNPEEYLGALREMTKLDLQQESIRLGHTPHDNREIMIERLYKECSKQVAAAKTSSLQPKPIKVSKRSLAILQKAGNYLA